MRRIKITSLILKISYVSAFGVMKCGICKFTEKSIIKHYLRIYLFQILIKTEIYEIHYRWPHMRIMSLNVNNKRKMPK